MIGEELATSGVQLQVDSSEPAKRELFRTVDRIDKVTKADIRRVAKGTFVPINRTVGIIENVASASAAAPQGGQQ